MDAKEVNVEERMVSCANTVVDPMAVMVEPINALIANKAVS